MRQPVKITPGSPKFLLYNEAIAEYLIGSLVPLSTVDMKEFRHMICTISGGSYDPPYRKYFTKTLLPKMMEDTTKEMRRELQTIRGCGVTTDAWTSLATEDYVTYTIHYITDDWKLNSKVLSTYSLEERHTADSLAKDMKLMEEKWGLNKLLFSPVYVHDNATKASKLWKEMELAA